MKIKPSKKRDIELWAAISKSISSVSYFFLPHCRMRLADRAITDIDVLDILENKLGRGRRRNKSKDSYLVGYEDWNYCIEGKDIDKKKIRIIISFRADQMMFITVIRLES